MKFIVDEYPIYNSSCPFCEEGHKKQMSCALISYEDFMTEQKKE